MSVCVRKYKKTMANKVNVDELTFYIVKYFYFYISFYIHIYITFT